MKAAAIRHPTCEKDFVLKAIKKGIVSTKAVCENIGVFRILSIIYDGVFLRKYLTALSRYLFFCKKNSIIDVWQRCKCVSNHYQLLEKSIEINSGILLSNIQQWKKFTLASFTRFYTQVKEIFKISLRCIIFVFPSLAFLRGQILLFYLDASRECTHPLIETSSRGSYNSSEFDLDNSFLPLRSLFPLEVI